MEHVFRYVWTLRDEATVWKCAHLLNTKLDAEDRALAAATTLLSLDYDEAAMVSEFALSHLQLRSPPPSFASDYQSDASWWVENALPSERMHYWKAISNSFDIKQAERALRYMDRLYEKRLVA